MSHVQALIFKVSQEMNAISAAKRLMAIVFPLYLLAVLFALLAFHFESDKNWMLALSGVSGAVTGAVLVMALTRRGRSKR